MATANDVANLFSTKHRRLVRVFSRTARINEDEAEEYIQHAYMRAIKSIHTFDHRSSLETWVLTIATNIFRNDLSRKYRFVENAHRIPSCVDAGYSSNAGDYYDAMYIEKEIENLILTKLHPVIRDAFINVELNGMSIAEYARKIGAPEATVRVRLHRARERIKAHAMGTEGPRKAQDRRSQGGQ